MCKYDIEESISREMSGDLKDGMLTIGTLMLCIIAGCNIYSVADVNIILLHVHCIL